MRTLATILMLAALIVPARAEELAAPGAAIGAPAITCCTAATIAAIGITYPHVVLIITADGKTMRGDKEIKDLPREELLTVINELIVLIKRR